MTLTTEMTRTTLSVKGSHSPLQSCLDPLRQTVQVSQWAKPLSSTLGQPQREWAPTLSGTLCPPSECFPKLATGPSLSLSATPPAITSSCHKKAAAVLGKRNGQLTIQPQPLRASDRGVVQHHR